MISIGEASVIGITAAAGLLAALRRWRIYQRRHTQTHPDTTPTPLGPAVQRAVSAAHHATTAPTAPDPDSLITRRTPPADPQPEHVVTIGTTGADEVPLQLLARPGGIAWSGPGAHAALRALLISVLTAAERQRTTLAHTRALVPQDLAQQLLPGLPVEFSALAQTPGTAEAVRRAEEHLLAHARHAASWNDDVAEAPEPAPGVLLLVTRYDRVHAGQLEALAARSSTDTLIVLTTDEPLPGAANWHITENGTTTDHGPACPQPLKLFQLALPAAEDVLNMLLGAHGRQPRPRTVPATDDPAEPSVPVLPGEPDSSADAAPAREANEGNAQALDHSSPPCSAPSDSSPVPQPEGRRKPIRLSVLGPLVVNARDDPEPIGNNLKAETREFLTLLTAHPAGLLTADIARNLLLSEDPDQTARDMKNLRRAVRRTLRSATGITSGEFILRHGEIHKLNSELIETDLDDFQKAARHASAASTDEEHTAALQQMMALYRGPFAAGADHLWADGLREHLANQVCDAVLRRAHHAEHTGYQDHQDAAMALIEQAIVHHPDDERLYAAAIRLHQAAGRGDAAQRTYTRLERHLAQLDLKPDPAVQALLTTKTK